jgi:hypothetical protein
VRLVISLSGQIPFCSVAPGLVPGFCLAGEAISRIAIMSALPHKQTYAVQSPMSASGQKRTSAFDKPTGTHLGRPTFLKMVSSKAAEYRENAELCEKEAEHAPTSYYAEQFRKLAQHWRELAEHAEDKVF